MRRALIVTMYSLPLVAALGCSPAEFEQKDDGSQQAIQRVSGILSAKLKADDIDGFAAAAKEQVMVWAEGQFKVFKDDLFKTRVVSNG